jgi:hypothetical protein
MILRSLLIVATPYVWTDLRVSEMTWIDVNIYMCMRKYICMWSHTCMWMYMCMCHCNNSGGSMWKYICMCMRKYICMWSHICMWMYICMRHCNCSSGSKGSRTTHAHTHTSSCDAFFAGFLEITVVHNIIIYIYVYMYIYMGRPWHHFPPIFPDFWQSVSFMTSLYKCM